MTTDPSSFPQGEGDSGEAPQPPPPPSTRRYRTAAGLQIVRRTERLPYENAIEPVVDALDEFPGCLFASDFEYPGRYTRYDIGFCRPPLALQACGRSFELVALNERGKVVLAAAAAALHGHPHLREVESSGNRLRGRIPPAPNGFPEELRSKQPTVFSVLRALIDGFGSDDPFLGLYGAFGYELAFQFEAITQRLPRKPQQRDLVLYLPDDLYVVDHRRQTALRHRYEFAFDGHSSAGRDSHIAATPYRPGPPPDRDCDHAPGEYADTVRSAIDAFRRGDLFEVVPGQVFRRACQVTPSTLFRRLRRRNPAPYGALLNLGQGEYLVAASPEMYVRVEGRRIETCLISGTIARGRDAIEDAEQIRTLLNSRKDASELTMCTDVDRNDKSRVCEPGSVRVIGRREIEKYARLIHTVDHVEGRLRDGFDALDGFLAHTWAVTVTGAPKQRAIQFIEDHERSPRRWYGGAIGYVGFDGGMNTGLTLRTVQIDDGVASVRAGATLLYESDPDAEEAETRLKASALLDAITRGDPLTGLERSATATAHGRCPILMVDHQDSFVHTLAGYFRSVGGDVETLRSGFDLAEIDRRQPRLVLLSPGPGRPADFDLSGTIAAALAAARPVFGVCLGLQGIVEHFGGRLGLLPRPMHGKTSEVIVSGSRLFDGLPKRFRAGRYHSLYVLDEDLPEELEVTARSRDGIVMAVEHRQLPVAGVQFHPESILSLERDVGLGLVRNVMARLCAVA